MAGVGHRTVEGQNFLIVKSGINFSFTITHIGITINFADTDVSIIEESFKSLTNRNDVGIILINQHVRINSKLTIFEYLLLYLDRK